MVSCAQHEEEFSCNSKYSVTEDISDGHTLLVHEETSVYPYGGMLYALGENELTAYDLYNNMSCTVLAEPDGSALSALYGVYGAERCLFVDESYIYILRQDAILLYTHDGNLVKTISCDFLSLHEDVIWEYPGIFAYGNSVFVSFWERTWNGTQYDSVFRFFIIDSESGACSESDEFGDLYEIYSMTPWSDKDDGTYLVAARCVYQGNDSGAFGTMEHGVFRYDPAKDKLELIRSFKAVDGQGMDYVNTTEMLYYFDYGAGYTVLGSMMREEDVETPDVQMQTETMREQIRAITENDAPIMARDMFFTGQDYILFTGQFSEDKLTPVISIYSVPPKADKELTILYQKDALYESSLYEYGLLGGSGVSRNLEYITMEFEEYADCRVNRMGYSHQDFTARLRMKLLAGETDFDIVYMEESGELLSPILNNELYLPLETRDGITAGFSQYIDGVDDVMTHDGHLFGIPLVLSAEAVRNSRDGALEKIKCIAEDGYRAGAIDEAAIMEVLEIMRSLTDTVTVPVQYWSEHYDDTPDLTDTELKPVTSPAGNHYAALSSFVFAYKNTAVPDLALDYMEFLLSEDIVSLAAWNDKSYLLEDTTKYYNLEESIMSEGPIKKSAVTFNDKQNLLTERAADILTGSRVYTINWSDELSRKLWNIASDVQDGILTPEEGAVQIVSELNYRLFE